MFMPMKPTAAPPVFFAASCIAFACARARFAAAMPGFTYAFACCISLSICSSSSLAFTLDTPKETISSPRRSRHLFDSTSLSASAISYVWPGRLLYRIPMSDILANAG